jgi:hypothetical protein
MTLKDNLELLTEEKVKEDLIKTIFISIVTSFITFVILYLLKLRFIDDFLPKYGFFLFFAIISYALILPSIKQVKAYKEFPCMSGMMIGMTIGMITGFLPGFFIGATNGMFWGSIFGMSLGILSGIWAGKCCGIMGIMEGTMAGFMGGLMGAMTAIMMFNENLKTIAIIVFFISAFIIFGLNFMISKETKGVERKDRDATLFTIVLSFILTILTILIMVFGPRSILLQ